MKKRPLILKNGKVTELPKSEIIAGGAFSKRFVNEEILIDSEDEMILSDFVDIDENGTLEIDGLFTILGE